MYDLGFPLVRSWLYGIGGFIVVAAAFAIGFVIAGNGRTDTAEVEVPAAVVTDESADDVIVVRAAAERPRFPAFAPEGVIVVPAPTPGERALAAAETVQERQTVERATSGRAESAERRARSNLRRPARPPVAVARAEASAPQANPETSVEERGQDIQPTRDEAAPVREYEAEYADNEASAEESDSRSWYGSEEYRREVEERRRAEREARRRRNGW